MLILKAGSKTTMQFRLRATAAMFVLALVAAASLSGTQRSLADAPYATTSPTATSSAAASPALSDDKVVAARARDRFGMLQRGDIDRAQLTKALNDGLPADKVAQVSAFLKPLGTPQSFTLIDKTQLVAEGVRAIEATLAPGLRFDGALHDALGLTLYAREHGLEVGHRQV